MTIPAQVVRQRDFSAGQINPETYRRDDADLFKYALRKGRNVQGLRSGAVRRRFGRKFLYADGGVRGDFSPFEGESYSVTFAGARITVRDLTGATVFTTAAPWSAAILLKLVWESFENQMFIAGPGFRTRVLSKSAAGVWSLSNFTFDTSAAGKILAPFYRFAAKGVTMQPSALTGSITVTFSAAVLSAQHVGVVFRYAGRQLVITAVTNATTATATVIENLNGTVQFTMDAGAEMNTFAVGEIAETSSTGMEIEIIAIDIPNRKITGVILNRYRKPITSERLVSPNGDADFSAASVVFTASPGATTVWDEIFMSDYRGWPQSVSKDVQRLIFCDFPQKKQAIGWSAVSQPQNFLVSDDAAGAILELIQKDCRVFHVIGGYDEFAITDIGAFYIPISVENPLKPGSVEFRQIYAGSISQVRPVQVTEGVLFVDGFRNGVYAITATGQTARPYLASEVSEFHRQLFSGVVALAANSGTSSAAARHIYVVNADGSMVVGLYNSDRSYVGWWPWDGQGTVKHVYARTEEIVVSATYPKGAGSVDVAEALSDDVKLDSALDASGGSVSTAFVGATLQVIADGFYMGDVVVGGGGAVAGFDDYSEVWAGYLFDWEIEPLLPAFEGGESYGQRLRRRKIAKIMIAVHETQEFECENRRLAGYAAGDDTSLAMPARTDVFSLRVNGRSYDPTYTLRQTVPGDFTLLELTTEVTV